MSVPEAQLLAALAEKFLAGTATAAEQEQLHQLYDKWKDDEETVVSATEQSEVLRIEILQAIKERIKGPGSLTPFYKRKLWRLIAAASILVVTGVLLFYFIQPAPSKNAFTSKDSNPPTNQLLVVPGKDRATLTLSNGTVIDLDSSGNGLIATQHGAKVMVQNGKVVYNATSSPDSYRGTTDHSQFNTISTPRGGQYRLVLPDGTKVWLNATSALKFPVAFRGNSRTVELTGEAYFEVAKNPARPFKVIIPPLQGGLGGVEVKVLGTHFNIMAYGEEGKITTTLLEGSVHVSRGAEKHVMVPGEQATWKENGDFNLNEHADLEEVLAWKNEKFHFNNANIKVIMRQIARWYDVEVEYRNISSETQMGGIVSRREDLRQLLDYFEIVGKVRFTVEGRKIIVSR